MANPRAVRFSGEENDSLKYGASCVKGACGSNHVAHTAMLQLDGSESTSFFGIFDGHGGDKVALYCSEQFHSELIKDPDYVNYLSTAIENVYFSIDDKLENPEKWNKSHSPGKRNLLMCLETGLYAIRRLWKKPYIAPQEEGTTACVALIRGNHTTVGNAGDSRCVLSRNGQAINLSTDHKPDDPAERLRIENAGGKVLRNEIDKIELGQFDPVGIQRVDGKVAVSRAIGYFKYKQNIKLSADHQKVTCKPDIRTCPVLEESLVEREHWC